ncbi:MAG: UDP-3-O-(3-hydroxymyristoyl)glucosamine N-acyltransferase [Candidatus Omnitrophica bacterium]|nr:UDP-3-O-(3-hydroxymyristoyl)glucosamine N-acyltransferase [Candidatus Omnitrophota bacterium]
MQKTLSELAQIVGGKLIGDGNTLIKAITNIETPEKEALTFVTEEKFLGSLAGTTIAAVIVPPSISQFEKPLIQCPNPKLAWARLLWVFHPARAFDGKSSEKAVIHPTAKIGAGVTIESFAVIGENSVIGDRAVVRSGCVIDRNVQIGAETILQPNVMIYENCRVGNRVILHAGTVIGADGFGYVMDAGKYFKVPQLGNVVIEDDVEIGANTTIDRATMGSTIIRRGAKIDNLVQIAHNCDIGEHTVASAQVGISGSCTVGKYVTLAGQVGLGDHCEIGDQAIIGAQAGLPTGKKIPPQSAFLGSPARPLEDMKKQFAAQLRSAETLKVVRDLVKRVEALEQVPGT